VKKLIGKTDIQDALGRLERLVLDEIGMAATQGLKATHEVGDKVQSVDDKIDLVIDGVQLTLNQPAHVTESYPPGTEKVGEGIKQVLDGQKR
jgi:hypothetical protein